jgi:hypothetical protein
MLIIFALPPAAFAAQALWSDCFHPAPTCKVYTGTDGQTAQFSLDALLAPGGHRLNDTRAYPSFEYVFNVGSNVAGAPNGACATTVDDAATGVDCRNPATGNPLPGGCPAVTHTSPSGGYQIWDTDEGTKCHRLTGDLSAAGADITWGLVDTDGADPTLGVTLTMSGGDGTLLAYDQNNPTYRAPFPRALRIIMRCTSDDSPLPTVEEVIETQQGLYEISLETVHGCPTQCPRTGASAERLCADHGTCQVILFCFRIYD